MDSSSSSTSIAAVSEKQKKMSHVEAKGFVDEMRVVAMKMHTKDQAKEGEKESNEQEPEGQPLSKWEPSIEGYLKFLVDSKLVFDTLEKIVENPHFTEYAEFRNTRLERSERLAKDLVGLKEKYRAIPEPSTHGINYAQYLKEISENDTQAFMCHFYNIYFAHSAGGRMIGRKVSTYTTNISYVNCKRKNKKWSTKPSF
ncbi:OLC1v1024456C2 [Oldenlandia corymbosa var. corymbosa]|uniref:heme oxygenase (biliverdin-producing) n=1 Tax=Oldenlandia corymbosa var. corymbosa TaxID=529605 RepID=A0AAV1C2D7_OLDCO|nr:OLC1v1024456C2 [Oldenlandia corymbosa var. corymbosa]